MNYIKGFMVLSLFWALTGCTPSSIVEGEVVSSRTIAEGIKEHLVKTDSPYVPYFIVRTNKNNLKPGAKVELELPGRSMASLGY